MFIDDTVGNSPSSPQVGFMDDLQSIRGVGPQLVKEVLFTVNDSRQCQIIDELQDMLVITDDQSNVQNIDNEGSNVDANVVETEVKSSQMLTGRVIVFTGKLLSMTRAQASSICEKLGNIAL